MARKNYSYKDKNVIISVFNESQVHYRKYEELIGGNPSEAQKELNTAANKLQQSFELGLKCYLNLRYKELVNEHVINWSQYRDFVKIIENGRHSNNRMVDIRYLYDQMNCYAKPKMEDSDVNFELIKRNNGAIYNDNKHIGNDVDVIKFRASYAEIRKFVLTYIDPNPPIQIIQSPEYINLQEACEFWDKDSRYNYCLICDRTELDDSSMRKLLYINWSLIIDFDTNSDKAGLYHAYIEEYSMQPNSFDISSPKNTVFNAASNIPYWFHICGVEDIPESLAENNRRWNQKYGSQMSECICKYRKAFSKPIKVIILSGDAKKIEKILSVLDAVYEDSLKLFLLSSEVQYESIKEDYEEVLQYYPLSAFDFVQGISNFSSLFNRKLSKEEYCVSGKDGKVGIRLEDYSCFEIPYIGIADDDCDVKDKECEAFYQGERILSWYGAKHGFAINRIVQYRRIKNIITSASIETSSKIVRLYHDPGAGGTTLARLVSYELSKEMPVVILKSYNNRITPKQLENLYRDVRMTILIVVESSTISEDDLQKFNGELMSSAVPHVFLYVNRLNKSSRSSDDDLRILIDSEFDEMCEKLTPYINEEKQDEIRSLSRVPSERYPFFMSMYAFDERFKGVKDYIKHFMINITQNDLSNLIYISLVDRFANRNLDINFLHFVDADDPLGIFENDVNKSLITSVEVGPNRFVKIRHPRFAEEIIDECIASETENDGMKRAENLTTLIRSFIKYSKQNIMYDFDSTIDILKNLLILRDTDSMVRDKFSPVIEYLKSLIPISVSENEKYTCIGLIFKDLVNTYPEEPHFKAHLSRYYSHIEKNYEKGIQEAKEAVNFAEQRGENDALLYHIYGMSIRRYVEQRLFDEAKESYSYSEVDVTDEKLKEIQIYLSVASEQFMRVRDTNNKVAGYISDIEMCIAVIDFGKELYGLSTEEFIKKYKKSWFMNYYDRALTLMEGFRNIQVEEDTEFYKVRLSTRCIETLQDMIYNIENTVSMWEEYLGKASENERPVVRRFIARAKEKQLTCDEGINVANVDKILDLMEENIKQEPSNGANIRIWFNALRYSEKSDSDILLDEALQKLATWKQIGDNFEAYYYYFILVCIKAIESSSRAEAIIPELQEELRNKTAHMPNNRVIYEWLGEGKGVKRLINAYENVNGKYRRISLDIIENEAHYIEGRITKYNNDRSAQIRAYNMEVFFSPSGQVKQSTQEDINKRVKFVLGFSYDGLRALNKSVQIIDYVDEKDIANEIIGKKVKCIVIGHDISGNYLKVRLYDYRNMVGSVHSSVLPDKKTVYDYKINDIIWGIVESKRFVKKEGRDYYQIRMKDEAISDDWKKKLASIKFD